ncbi:uncharacterized protein LOC119405916 [Rhipicephalus sanguineus]|uniref:uncharacterized protein LOC119405916 n=1 Tax=Rhipicephalus sanguineus TaxID=34632 RepID=UPI0018952961|nr:uncharacterized protein LOC119405916 [Rhipicephalus sanguineus]
MASEDIPKTAITKPFGLFEFLRMPFGLRNSGQTFQRFINGVLHGLDFCHAYLDDLLIASSTPDQHEVHLRSVFQRLAEHGILVNTDKSEFGVHKLTFLGHVISSSGIKPHPDKVKAVEQFPQPNNKRQLREFLGLVNYYRRFIPQCATILQPLHLLLSTHEGAAKDTKDALKAALMASEEHSWVEALPIVLWGIRTAFKADVGCSAAELVYGTTLRLPGEFFVPDQQQTHIPAGDYASRLRHIMTKLRPTPPRQPTERSIYVSSELESCSHIFLRNDVVRSSLQAPYDGPFRVLRHGRKTISIERHGRQEVVSLDRVKPAHMETNQSTTETSALPPETCRTAPHPTPATDAPVTEKYHTRSGRRTGAPNRLNL